MKILELFLNFMSTFTDTIAAKSFSSLTYTMLLEGYLSP